MLFLVLLVGEIFARYNLGLGDPPLSVADPQIEYLFKPNATYHRFGNRITYNAYSMRSEALTRHKLDPREVRLMVMGDSVVNGGVLTDQNSLATSLLGRWLSKRLGYPVIVGNISAGSWGPPNLLAYARRFGFFDADVVVIVLSSHDFSDVPTFEPIVGVNQDFPSHRPLFALEEATARYLPRYVPVFRRIVPLPTPLPAVQKQAAVTSLAALRDLLTSARRSGASVIVAQHLEKWEISVPEQEGHMRIKRIAEQCRASIVQLGPAFATALRTGFDPYRDSIHPNDLGQRIIAESLSAAVERILRHRQRQAH